MKNSDNRIIIVGATSGIGRALAERYIDAGWTVGVAGRNEKALAQLVNIAPERVKSERIDILRTDALEHLDKLIEKCGGMDVYFHCAGIAKTSDTQSIEEEVLICETNATAFTRMILGAYNYFSSSRSKGKIVAITSIAGIRGLASLPAYSASKAYGSTLLEALRQRSHSLKLPIKIIDIKPGWTRTPLLDSSKKYLWETDATTVTNKIFKAAGCAKRCKVIGIRWKILTAVEKIIPGFLWEKLHIALWKDTQEK